MQVEWARKSLLRYCRVIVALMDGYTQWAVWAHHISAIFYFHQAHICICAGLQAPLCQIATTSIVVHTIFQKYRL